MRDCAAAYVAVFLAGVLAGVVLGVRVVEPDITVVVPPTPEVVEVEPPALDLDDVADAHLLARVAASEDPRAPEAVMWTVLNRRGSRALRDVATPSAYHGLRRPPRDTYLDRRLELRLELVALDVLAGRVPDPTGGATHFHRVGTPTPAWAPDPSRWVVLGSHAFYREVPSKKSVDKPRAAA